MKKKRDNTLNNSYLDPSAEKVKAPTVPLPDESSVPPLAEILSKHKDSVLILLLFLAALTLRGNSLKFYHVISTDGTSYVETARAIWRGDISGIGIYGFYPVLIWVVNSFISDGELAGRLVSVLFGSLLVIPLYLLGRDVFSRSVALSACLLAVVWPPLVGFSCEVMTQSTHTTLQLAGVYFVWRAFKEHRISDSCLAGLFFGLTYLTRPEGLLLFFMTPLAFFCFRFKETVKKPAFLAAYSGSFFVFFAINLLLVHHVTGEWQISAKTDSALNDALSYYLNIPDLGYTPGYEPKGYLDILRDHPGFIFKNSAVNIKKAWETILPVPLWIFFTIGLFSGGFSRGRNLVRFFLLSTAAPIGVLIVFYYIDAGYIVAYQPVFFLMTATGFITAEVWLKGKVTGFLTAGQNIVIGRIRFVIVASLVYSVMLVVPQITRKDMPDSEYLPETDNYRRAEKHIGLLLKESLPPGKIMTRWARIAFYAEREWVNIPAATTYEEVIRLARKSGVRFFIADGTLYGMRPMLGKELFEPLYDESQPYGKFFQNNSDYRVKGLRPFLLYTDPKSMGVVVYEIDQESG